MAYAVACAAVGRKRDGARRRDVARVDGVLAGCAAARSRAPLCDVESNDRRRFGAARRRRTPACCRWRGVDARSPCTAGRATLQRSISARDEAEVVEAVAAHTRHAIRPSVQERVGGSCRRPTAACRTRPPSAPALRPRSRRRAVDTGSTNRCDPTRSASTPRRGSTPAERSTLRSPPATRARVARASHRLARSATQSSVPSHGMRGWSQVSHARSAAVGADARRRIEVVAGGDRARLGRSRRRPATTSSLVGFADLRPCVALADADQPSAVRRKLRVGKALASAAPPARA